jgi:hypothetical protein
MNMIREKNRKEWTGVHRPGEKPMFDNSNGILNVLQKNYSQMKYFIVQVIS